MTKRRFFAAIMGVFATALAACSPGYMKASDLESKHQGPSDCEARCSELGMRMGALVIVSDTLPGCVCQPKPAAPAVNAAPGAVNPAVVPAPPAAAPPAPAPPIAPSSAPSPKPSDAAPISGTAPGNAVDTAADLDPTLGVAAIVVVRSQQVLENQRQAQQRQKNL